MKLKYNWPAIIGLLMCIGLVLFMAIMPFVNPCVAEDSIACTWNAATQGNGQGLSFTNFWGVPLYIYPPN